MSVQKENKAWHFGGHTCAQRRGGVCPTSQGLLPHQNHKGNAVENNFRNQQINYESVLAAREAVELFQSPTQFPEQPLRNH